MATESISQDNSHDELRRELKREDKRFSVLFIYVMAPFLVLVLSQLGWLMPLRAVLSPIWLFPISLFIYGLFVLVRSPKSATWTPDGLRIVLIPFVMLIGLCVVVFSGYTDSIAAWLIGNEYYRQSGLLSLPGEAGRATSFITRIGGMLIVNLIATSCYLRLYSTLYMMKTERTDTSRGLLDSPWLMIAMMVIFFIPSIGMSIIINSGF